MILKNFKSLRRKKTAKNAKMSDAYVNHGEFSLKRVMPFRVVLTPFIYFFATVILETSVLVVPRTGLTFFLRR